jgi:hypothetical protein
VAALALALGLVQGGVGDLCHGTPPWPGILVPWMKARARSGSSTDHEPERGEAEASGKEIGPHTRSLALDLARVDRTSAR